MYKQDMPSMPEYFNRYIDLVQDVPVLDGLFTTGYPMWDAERERFEALGTRVYAPGKWSANDLFQHLIDTERVLTYRALAIARGDTQSLPAFDEDGYAALSNAGARSMESLRNELYVVRASTIALFTSFTTEMMLREGIAGNRKISVLALGFVIAGHGVHHLNVLKERYYPMI